MKPGYQTTEFWVSLAPVLASLTNKDAANQELLTICAASLCGLYILSRTYVKIKEKPSVKDVQG
jgi:hypothetical protein